jgi:hypothetical protein
MVTCAAAYLFFSLKLIRRPTVPLTILAAAALTAAFFTKSAALPFMSMGLTALALRHSRISLNQRLIAIVAHYIIAGAVLATVYGIARAQGFSPASPYAITLDNVAVNRGVGFVDLIRLSVDLAVIWGFGLIYVTPILLLMIVWGLGHPFLNHQNWREVLYLVLPGIVFMIVPLFAKRPTIGMVPRYLLSSIPSLALLAGVGINTAADQIVRAISRSRPALPLIILLTVSLVPCLFFDFKLLTSPHQLKLPPADMAQYLIGDPSGTGRDTVIQYLLSGVETQDHIRVMGTGSYLQVQAYLGRRFATVVPVDSEDSAQAEVLARWLGERDPVFVLEDSRYPIPETPHGAVLLPLREEVISGGFLRVYKVEGIRGPNANDVFTASVPGGEKLAPDYAALHSLVLPGTALFVAPSGHAQYLPGATDLAFTVWPLTVTEARMVINTALQDLSDGTAVGLVLTDEARLDPQRHLLLAASNHLYWESEAYSGLVHLITGVAGPPDPPFSADNRGVFEDVIFADHYLILNPEVRPGDAVLIAIDWRTRLPVEDPFKVFIHVYDQEGNLVAQRDGEPVNGLRPLTSWSPEETIKDRIAMRLPTTLLPGTYVVRLGLYDPVSGLRLQAAGPAASADSLMIGQITVLEP